MPQCRCSKTRILRLLNLKRVCLMSHSQGFSDTIQPSPIHQVSPSRVALFPSPGIFLAGTSLKEYVLTAWKTPQNPKPNNTGLLWRAWISAVGGILLSVRYPSWWMLMWLSHTFFLGYLSVRSLTNPQTVSGPGTAHTEPFQTISLLTGYVMQKPFNLVQTRNSRDLPVEKLESI